MSHWNLWGDNHFPNFEVHGSEKPLGYRFTALHFLVATSVVPHRCANIWVGFHATLDGRRGRLDLGLWCGSDPLDEEAG